MRTQEHTRMSDWKSFEYTLDDYLQIKASLDLAKAKGLKNFFSQQKLQEFNLSPIEGFLLDRHLVLFHPGSSNPFKHIMFLNTLNGNILSKKLS